MPKINRLLVNNRLDWRSISPHLGGGWETLLAGHDHNFPDSPLHTLWPHCHALPPHTAATLWHPPPPAARREAPSVCVCMCVGWGVSKGTFLRGPRSKKDHWEGTINNIPLKFQAKRTRIARDTAPSCCQIHRDFKGIENLFCLKNGQNRCFNLWKYAVSGCVWEDPEWILSVFMHFYEGLHDLRMILF